MIEDNSCDIVYSCHVLEHFHSKIIPDIIKEWLRILKPNGILRISVPDFSKIVEAYSQNLHPINELLGLLHGGQTYLYNFHYMSFDYNLLEADLLKLGYDRVKNWNWKDTEHCDVDDFSQAYLPHMDKENGILMSLNIEGVKK